MSVGQSCIVLAGGLGTRLREAVPGRPKCLAPVGARSFLELHLEALAAEGVDRFVLSLGHMATMVGDAVAALRERYRIEMVVEERPLGTGGATLYALHWAGLSEAMVSNGDTFFDGRLDALREPIALQAGERMRLATVNVADRSRFGGLVLDGALVMRFLEKGIAGPGPINAGLYRVHRSAFGSRPTASAFSLETDVAPQLAATGALHATVVDGRFTDIGVPEEYERFCREHT